MRFKFILAAFLLMQAANLSAQEQCKGDWGSNFGEQWRDCEARFWANKLKMPVERIRAIQEAAQVSGFVATLDISQLPRLKKIVIVDVAGSARCASVQVLRESNRGFTPVWSLSSPTGVEGDIFCTANCGGLKVRLDKDDKIIVREPVGSFSGEPPDQKCKVLRYENWVYRWDGETYVPSTATKRKAAQRRVQLEREWQKIMRKQPHSRF